MSKQHPQPFGARRREQTRIAFQLYLSHLLQSNQNGQPGNLYDLRLGAIVDYDMSALHWYV